MADHFHQEGIGHGLAGLVAHGQDDADGLGRARAQVARRGIDDIALAAGDGFDLLALRLGNKGAAGQGARHGRDGDTGQLGDIGHLQAAGGRLFGCRRGVKELHYATKCIRVRMVNVLTAVDEKGMQTISIAIINSRYERFRYEILSRLR